MTKPADNQPDDSCIVIAGGLATLGFLRPIGRAFEVFAVADGGFVHLGDAPNRADALRLLASTPQKQGVRS
jgi:hypothetical protein